VSVDPTTPPPPSPWEAAAGDLLDELHPRLRPYFAAIPAGSVGVGHGVFDRVGTPRRWLWPVLAVLARQGVLFPVWRRDVPFGVVNSPATDAEGNVAVGAVRTFAFTDDPVGPRHMVDAITAGPDGLVDHLGTRRRWSAALAVAVADGGLVLTSGALAVRVGRRRLPLPRRASPRVTLHEAFDPVAGRQRVSMTLDAPVVGRIYEYSGHFDYRVEPRTAAADQDARGTTA
jgi:hypothetical protein